MTAHPAASAADELRTYYACRELAALGLRAVPAYDEHGRPTGLVAIDPEEFSDWLADGIAELDETGDCEEED
jgi:hypothetical protein